MPLPQMTTSITIIFDSLLVVMRSFRLASCGFKLHLRLALEVVSVRPCPRATPTYNAPRQRWLRSPKDLTLLLSENAN